MTLGENLESSMKSRSLLEKSRGSAHSKYRKQLNCQLTDLLDFAVVISVAGKVAIFWFARM